MCPRLHSEYGTSPIPNRALRKITLVRTEGLCPSPVQMLQPSFFRGWHLELGPLEIIGFGRSRGGRAPMMGLAPS